MFCKYDQDTGHTTHECLNLEKVLGKMKPVAEAPPAPPVRRETFIPTGHRTPKQEPVEEVVGDILTIEGGGVLHGAESWEGRRYASDVDQTSGEKRPRLSTEITFTDEDMIEVTTPTTIRW